MIFLQKNVYCHYISANLKLHILMKHIRKTKDVYGEEGFALKKIVLNFIGFLEKGQQ